MSFKINKSMIVFLTLLTLVVLTISISSVSAADNSSRKDTQGIGTILALTAPTISEGQSTNMYVIMSTGDGKSLSNQRISVNINKKEYFSNTNSKGIATFKISGIKAGSYKVNAIYYGNGTYASSYANGTQSVKGSVKPTGNLPDLIVTKIQRSGNSYKVTVKNQGKATTSGKFALKLWVKSKKYDNNVVFNKLAKGKSVTKTVNFFSYSKIKGLRVYAEVNYNKYTKESNYNNNVKSIKV